MRNLNCALGCDPSILRTILITPSLSPLRAVQSYACTLTKLECVTSMIESVTGVVNQVSQLMLTTAQLSPQCDPFLSSKIYDETSEFICFPSHVLSTLNKTI